MISMFRPGGYFHMLARPRHYMHKNSVARLTLKIACLCYEDVGDGMLNSAKVLDDARGSDRDDLNKDVLKVVADGYRAIARSFYAKRDLVVYNAEIHESTGRVRDGDFDNSTSPFKPEREVFQQ